MNLPEWGEEDEGIAASQSLSWSGDSAPDRGEDTRSGHLKALLSKTGKPYLQMKPARAAPTIHGRRSGL